MKTRSKINLMVSTLAAIALGCVIGCDQRDSELTFIDEPMLSAPAPSERSITYTIPEWGVRFGSVQSVENYPIWTTNAANKVYALATGINNYKWDWVTQVTNSPFVFHTTGFPYVETPIGFAATDSGQGYAVPSSASFAGAKVHGIESLGAGDGIITNCYGGIGLGMAFNVTNDVAFVWSGRSYNEAIKYGSHGMSTFNVDPHDGPAGFWIGETNLATYLQNAGGPYDHDHDHLTSNNEEWRLVQMDDGHAVVMPSYYYGEDNGLGVKFMPSIPIEDLHDICSTNALARISSSMKIELDGSVSSAGYGYTMGSGNTATFYATNKVSYAEGVVFPDTVQISFDVPFTSGRIYIYNIQILCGRKKTLVTTDYIKSKVQNVNVNLQSAEDTRAALTNLITILKNL